MKTSSNFSWLVDFPLVEYDPDEERYVAVHHPLYSPRIEDIDLLESEPHKCKARAYDLIFKRY